jgi:hypothetical protein
MVFPRHMNVKTRYLEANLAWWDGLSFDNTPDATRLLGVGSYIGIRH